MIGSMTEDEVREIYEETYGPFQQSGMTYGAS